MTELVNDQDGLENLPPACYDRLENYLEEVNKMTNTLCWRCGLAQTSKLIDGKPVCETCMLADARANKGIVPNYSDLTPVGRKHDTPAPATKPRTPRPAVPGGAKVADTTLSDTSKARLRGLQT